MKLVLIHNEQDFINCAVNQKCCSVPGWRLVATEPEGAWDSGSTGQRSVGAKVPGAVALWLRGQMAEWPPGRVPGWRSLGGLLCEVLWRTISKANGVLKQPPTCFQNVMQQ